MRWTPVLRIALLLGALGVAAPALGSALPRALARGDDAFASRAEQIQAGLAAPDAVERAIAAYRDALALDAGRIDARWRLLRALHYRGDFADVPADAKREAFEAGTDLADRSLAALAERLGGEPLHEIPEPRRRARLEAAGVAPADAAQLYFWTAVHWGAWSREAGLLRSVTEGVANRVHDYALVSAGLDPTLERGGPHRLLARLHAALPRVPFVSGWVDRARAIPSAERALQIAPDDPGNRYLLGVTLLELAPERRAEARGLLRAAAGAEPRPGLLAEDLATAELARRALTGSEGAGSASG